ncbi:MAG: dTMP kinase, partial [Deltaproteobacteria bacterium]|nr:dTMP kinase [Deltaproteobacteria bacterium]
MFITLEGIEGSGKTTQINNISRFLENKGHDCVITREPGGT